MSASQPLSTGGFVYRAERTTLESTPTTASHVGPGTYRVDATHPGGALPAAAPFHTSADRNPEAAITPGPGAYDVAAAAAALLGGVVAQRHASSKPGFADGSERMSHDKSRAFVPGPGTYSAGPQWVKKSHRYSAPEARGRLSFQRAATAPSIPANHQSYGYEESAESGMLVMQKPQEPTHTGVGLDRVGPGSYNPDTTPIAPRVGDKAPTWSNSHTTRLAKYQTDVPGPGSYQLAAAAKTGPGVTVSINGVDVMFGGAGGSSSFASKAPRAHQRTLQEHEVTPGPGSYLAIPSKERSSHPHFFGSTGPRGFEIDPVRSSAAPTFYKTPGPGAYESAARRSISAGPRTGAFVDTNPFNMTSARFSRNDNGIPGPGEYQLDNAASIKKDVHSQAFVGRSGVFGSTARRFSHSAGGSGQVAGGTAVASALGWGGGSNAPGPASYENNRKPHKPGSKFESSSFASHSDRFYRPPLPSKPDLGPRSASDTAPVRGDPAARGPGAYNLAVPWVKKQASHKTTGFGSESKRPVPTASKSNTPGPGRYQNDVDMNVAFRPAVNPAPEAGFGNVSARFKDNPRYAPGPGQYDIDRSSISKHSYNVTYNG